MTYAGLRHDLAWSKQCHDLALTTIYATWWPDWDWRLTQDIGDYIGIDALAKDPEGWTISVAERWRTASYRRHQDITLRISAATSWGNRAELKKCQARYGLYGYTDVADTATRPTRITQAILYRMDRLRDSVRQGSLQSVYAGPNGDGSSNLHSIPFAVLREAGLVTREWPPGRDQHVDDILRRDPLLKPPPALVPVVYAEPQGEFAI